MTAEEYLKQFTPQQWLAVYEQKMEGFYPEDITKDTILNSDGWKHVPPAWVEHLEERGMVTLEEIREQGGFGHHGTNVELHLTPQASLENQIAELKSHLEKISTDRLILRGLICQAVEKRIDEEWLKKARDVLAMITLN